MADSTNPAPSEPENTTPPAEGSAAAPGSVGRAKDAAGNAAAAAAVSVVKAIVTRNAGEAVKGVGTAAATESAKGAAKTAVGGAAKTVAAGAAKEAATDAAKNTAVDATKSAAEKTAENLFSNVKQDASKTAVGQAKGIADSVAEGDLKGTAGKAVQAVSVDADDNSIKGTAANIAKGAVGGAAGGALAGGVGAVPGAIVGAASGLLANKKGRALVIALIAVVVVIPALTAAFWFGSFVMVSSSMLSGMQASSAESVKSSGFTDEEVQEAIRKGGNTLAPWQMVKAIEDESKADIDGPLLNELMRKVNSNLDGFEMGAGTGFAPGAQWRSVGESDEDKAAAEEVKANWIAVLTEYAETHTLDPEKTYKLALMWYLGEKLDECSAGGPLPELTEHEFTLPDGSKRTLTDVQMTNAGAIFTEAKKIEGVNENALIIMFMAAFVESGLKNYANETIPESLTYPHDAVGKDHDSVGFWQMRRHWATPYGDMSKLMTVPYQVAAILGGPTGPNYPSPRGIFDIRDWETRDKGEVAQAVEVSAYPDRYTLQEPIATELVKYLSNGGAIGSCGNIISGDFAHPLGDPTRFGITSSFGPRDSICNASGCSSSFHRGTDFGAACGSPLYAVSSGVVTRTGVNGGWGNVVEYDMDDGTKLRYAHQPYGTTWPATGTRVNAGDLIGAVGQTGVSQGCHLHIEVLVGGAQVDFYPWATERGIILYFRDRGVDGYVPGAPTLR